MERLISDFKGLLGEEKKLYSAILELSKRKRASITDNNIEALDEIVREEQNLILTIGSVEEKRREYTDRFALALGLSPDTVKLRDIIDRCPDGEKEALTLLHRELLAIVEEQVKLNETNEMLVKSKLEYIDFVLDMTSSAGQTGTYGSEGKETSAGGKKSKMIDFKI